MASDITFYWIDPPSGWAYGFPKIYNARLDGSINDWLLYNGYPDTYINEDWFHVRMWNATEEEVDKYYV